MTQNSFYSAMYLANLLYGTSFTNQDDFAEIGLIGWSELGNKNTILYHYDTEVDPDTLTVLLPCNCDIVEAVVAPHEDWDYTDNLLNLGNWETAWTEEYIEHHKKEYDMFYTHGHFIHYKRIGDTLYFQHPYDHIHILYKGIVLDEEGLPYLNDTEVKAIATYVAYVTTFKESILSMNLSKLALAQQLERKWNLYKLQARNPEEVSQNDMNEVADAKTRWTTSKYGRSYKPLMK